MKKEAIEKNSSTEEKIKEAARKVFLQKGYAATRTRDIAEEAGFNLALLNYYFRSKEKLFDIIMVETMQHFLHSVKEILSNEQTGLQEKLELLVERYINVLIKNPEMPFFILNEVRHDPKKLLSKIGLKQKIADTYFIKQVKDAAGKGKTLHPMQIIMNLIGMIIFPFIAKPIVQHMGNMDQDTFNELMEERKKLIPIWLHMILTENTSK